MKKEILNCEKARSICLVETLAKLGHFPNRKSGKEAWFLSPFRSEAQASFKVSLRDNYWIDFGTFEGGNTIDLIVKLNQCSVKEALVFLSNETSGFSFQQQRIFEKETVRLEIQKVQTIQHQALLNYLKSRKIPISVAKRYCKEVWYRNKGRTFFAIGLKNQLGGWELRNKYYKTSTSPKTYSHFNKGHQNLIVVEGMFDLLSLEALLEEGLKDNDVIILNSVAFIKRIMPFLGNYKSVKLYLDNDTSGDRATEYLLESHSKSTDYRATYEGYKDANEKLML
ncbi:toprim domain-containing protein [Aquimarina sp. AU119]|uniref:toprim domain-containing protein n=1 Tax=Aquimarina sp. AU119 TaxID=2108528 RepID=UPI000D68BE2B|nr:toprim domain-containing protein [Aquimarina sp. AU119]